MIAITFRQLQVFVSVARSGTVRAAACQLFMSQSATSQSLAELEQRLDVVLFERLGRRLELNDAGHRLLPQAEKVLNGMAELVDTAQDPKGAIHGTLHVAASNTIGTYLLPMLAGQFVDTHPAADLQLRLRNTQGVMRDIQSFEADLGLIEGQCTESRLVSEVWRQDEMVIVCSPRHSLAKKEILGEDELQSAQWILREPGSGSRAIFESAIHPHVERIKVRMELDQHEAIKQAVRVGFGLGCLSRLSVAEELARGDLVSLKSPLHLTRAFSLVWHPERYRSPLWQAFKVFLQESG